MSDIKNEPSAETVCLLRLAVGAEIASREIGTPAARLMAVRVNWATVAAGYFFEGVSLAMKNPGALSIETLKLFRNGMEAMMKLEKSYREDKPKEDKP